MDESLPVGKPGLEAFQFAERHTTAIADDALIGRRNPGKLFNRTQLCICADKAFGIPVPPFDNLPMLPNFMQSSDNLPETFHMRPVQRLVDEAPVDPFQDRAVSGLSNQRSLDSLDQLTSLRLDWSRNDEHRIVG